MSRNMRKPAFLKLYCKAGYVFPNQEVIEDGERLGINADDVVIEIGSGNGQALEEIKKHEPSETYAVEISEEFRTGLQSRFRARTLLS